LALIVVSGVDVRGRRRGRCSRYGKIEARATRESASSALAFGAVAITSPAVQNQFVWIHALRATVVQPLGFRFGFFREAALGENARNLLLAQNGNTRTGAALLSAFLCGGISGVQTFRRCLPDFSRLWSALLATVRTYTGRAVRLINLLGARFSSSTTTFWKMNR